MNPNHPVIQDAVGVYNANPNLANAIIKRILTSAQFNTFIVRTSSQGLAAGLAYVASIDPNAIGAMMNLVGAETLGTGYEITGGGPPESNLYVAAQEVAASQGAPMSTNNKSASIYGVGATFTRGAPDAITGDAQRADGYVTSSNLGSFLTTGNGPMDAMIVATRAVEVFSGREGSGAWQTMYDEVSRAIANSIDTTATPVAELPLAIRTLIAYARPDDLMGRRITAIQLACDASLASVALGSQVDVYVDGNRVLEDIGGTEIFRTREGDATQVWYQCDLYSRTGRVEFVVELSGSALGAVPAGSSIILPEITGTLRLSA